jgi:alanine racemase
VAGAAAIAGRVCMDQFMLDLGDAPVVAATGTGVRAG